MNHASHWTRYLVAAVVFNPGHCCAAGPAVLPWDYTLNAIENLVAGPFAHFVILIAAICAVLGFALAGDNELVRRFVKAVVGTGLALLAVQLLNYLAA